MYAYVSFIVDVKKHHRCVPKDNEFRCLANDRSDQGGSNQSNQIKKFYLKSVHFITIQHKLSRAFQTDMHNKLHKLNTAQ